MVVPPPTPRKRRTREHIICDQSVNHVERFIIDAGHTPERVLTDYGYDLNMKTYDAEGYVEPGSVYFQLKASETLPRSGTDVVYDLDVRDVNLWLLEPLPVVLVLYEASRRRAYWLHVQAYFSERPARRPRSRAKTVRVRVPPRQKLTVRAVARMREIKQAALDQLRRERP